MQIVFLIKSFPVFSLLPFFPCIFPFQSADMPHTIWGSYFLMKLILVFLLFKGEFDTHDPKENGLLQPYLRKRSEIIEIVGASDIIFALSQLGICAAFSRATNQRICFMNGSSDEVIHSLFYNKNNDSLITVSVFGSEDFSDLRCRTTPIEYIRRGKPDAGFPLFETESLRPGFVEFDDENGKVLTHSAHDSIYKVFDLKNYTTVYNI